VARALRDAVHLQWLTERVGGMLLLMGVLHAVTIALLPVLGVVFSSIWRQLTPEDCALNG
jgi:hypothetical protein